MRLPFEEIWAAMEIIPQFFLRCRLDLCLGDYRFSNISEETLLHLQEEESCDKELLPVLFSEREIFWQPNLQPSLPAWYTRFNTFIVFINQYVDLLKRNDSPVDYLYAAVLHDLKTKARRVQKSFTEASNTSSQSQLQSLLRFRIATYPHVLFFMYHPYMPVAEVYTTKKRLDLMIQSIPRTHRLLQLLTEPCWRLQLLSEAPSSTKKTSTQKKSTDTEEK